MGVRTFKYKLWAFAIGAFVGGLAGVLFAGQIIFVNSDTFVLQFSILVLAGVVMGGAGNMAGAILGAFAAWSLLLPDRLPGSSGEGPERCSVLQRRSSIFGVVIC